MPLFDSLDELKAQFFGDHELQSVFIDDNFDDTVVKLCEKAVIRAEKNAKKDDKSKLAKAASKKQPPKGKNKSAQKRNAEALGEKEPTSKKQKISEEKTLKPKAGESTAANLSNSQLKKEQKRSGQGNSLLSVKPEEKDVPQEEAQSSPQEATECKEGKEAQIGMLPEVTSA
uniref:Hepatoma-derived growth factor-related protein 2 n=1 Tax=Steinernema glaseri TaxID=37863 RepID=A0A1I7XWZ0_9BILA